jgi:tRNA nucleotidyltransferase (CCA-adding enzyme)
MDTGNGIMRQDKSRSDIPDNISGILKTIGRIGDSRGLRVFAAGGFVRDILLGADNLDIDIVVEGDGLRFAEELAAKFHSPLKAHKYFGTAAIEIINKDITGVSDKPRDAIKLDIATARREYYKSPAAYPRIKFDNMQEDLKRRDFTINAMAFHLNTARYAEILDPSNGVNDLKKGVIRVLHDNSFIDDPTRIFRAARFEQRYNFKIDKHTEKLIRHAVKAGMILKLNKQRIEKERALISKEAKASRILTRLAELAGEDRVTYRQG